ncbi:MAG TPA: thrombospondin type 3 repeat-containing protein [Verrucomicrobiota bacterium]|nr:thrombospondin type 3 repeat-containing protein [Verrucomicrobiota bacterium]
MFSLLRANRRPVLWCLAAFVPWGVHARSSLVALGEEYAVGGSVPGDQVFARAAVGPNGGYLVWHDNVMDGAGYGIGARRLDQNFVAGLGAFRVNKTVAGDQEHPQVAMFSDGAAIVVWQGGAVGFPDVFARYLAADGTFATADIRVNSFTRDRQERPQVAVLKGDTAVVVWASYGQDGSHYGVYGQRLDARGKKIGGEFLVNESVSLSQRSPSVVAMPDGRFVVVWVSEKQNAAGEPVAGQEGVATVGPGRVVQPYDVSLFGRVFDASGPLGSEFKINTSAYVCANPVVSVDPLGGFLVAWSSHVGRVEVSGVTSARGWDIRSRAFASDGAPSGDETELNERTFGDQFLPSAASVGSNHLVAWISLGQDGSREGVYGRVVAENGAPHDAEFRINSFTPGAQKLPAVVSNGKGRAFVVWSRARGGLASFDLHAQRYASDDEVVAPAKPMVLALSASKLSVTWPSLEDLGAVSYLLYANGSSTPVSVTENYYVASPLAAGSTHEYRLAYVNQNGDRSPLSEPASGQTWGDDANFDGLPDDWQAAFWGSASAAWPSPNADSDADGASNRQEFLAGTDPTDPLKVLRLNWRADGAGTSLEWNAEAGCIYQVQVSEDLKQWENVGSPRFAAGTTDAVPVDRADRRAMYRVIRVR